MRPPSRSRMALGLWCAGALLAVSTAGSGSPQSAEQAEALAEQVDALDAEFAHIGTGDQDAQRKAMLRHWSMLQDHMRAMREAPGMAARSCGDWMMTGPDMAYGGAVGSGVRCSMLGHGMGPRSAEWALPVDMSPSRYRQQMQAPMRTMHTHMSAIAAEQAPASRRAMMREHYESLYRDLQTMRGMGWMWEPAPALPDAGARGAQLMTRYCGQCHAVPSPTLKTGSEWSAITQRMRSHLGESGAAGADVLVPGAAELEAISDYLRRHAGAR